MSKFSHKDLSELENALAELPDDSPDLEPLLKIMAFRQAALAARKAARVQLLQFGATVFAMISALAAAGSAIILYKNSLNAQNQIRAYVGVFGVTVNSLKEAGDHEVTITIKNAGTTTATDVENSFEVAVEETKRIDSGGSFRVEPTRPMNLPPGSSMQSFRQVPLTDNDRDAILSGEKLLRVEGHVRYRDVFGQPHTLSYCRMLGGDLKSGPTSLNATVLASCERGDRED